MIDNKHNVKLPTWYRRYGTALNETVTSFSDDLKERLRQYLTENPGLINEIGDRMSKAKRKENIKVILDHTKYKIVKGDRLMLRVDKTHSGGPDAERVYLKIENKDTIQGSLYFNKIASWFEESMEGIGTDPELFAATACAMHMDLANRGISNDGVQEVFDEFTDHWITTVYSEDWRGNKVSFKDWIEGDFSGRTEMCAMVLTRQPMPDDFSHGINWGSLAIDIGLLLVTLPIGGAGLWIKQGLQAGKGGVKAVRTVNRLRKLKKTKDGLQTIKRAKNIKKIRAAKALAGTADAVTGVKVVRYADAIKGVGKGRQLLKAGDQIVDVTPAMLKTLKQWKKLDPKKMQTAISQTFKNGDKFQYFTKAGKLQNVKFAGFSDPHKTTGAIKVIMREVDDAGALGGIIRTGMKNFVNFGDDVAKVGAAGAAESATILKNAGISLKNIIKAPWTLPAREQFTRLGLIGAHHLNPEWMHDSSDSLSVPVAPEDAEMVTGIDAPDVSGLQIAGEVSGWYNAMEDDSQEYVEYYRSQSAIELVEQLHDAMDGWTDDTDELAIAFMILAMDKTSANNVKTAWDDRYPSEGSFYENMIAKELEAGGWGFGADMRQMVGMYWYALTKDDTVTEDYKNEVNKIYKSITTKKK